MRLLIIMLAMLVVSACSKKETRSAIPESEQPSQLLDYGDQFYNEGDYESAFIAYGTIVNNFPSSREYIDASIGLSHCYGNFENYEKEFDILYELLRENLIPTKVPQIYNAIAAFYERSAGISEQLTGEGSSDYQTAINYYKKALDYPNSDDANSRGFAQYKTGALYATLNEPQRAIESFEKTVADFSGSEWALRAEQELTQLQEKVQRRAEFNETWNQPVQQMPQSGPGAMLPDSTLSQPDSSAIE